MLCYPTRQCRLLESVKTWMALTVITLGVDPSDNTWEDDSDDVVLLQLGTLSLCAQGRMTSWL